MTAEERAALRRLAERASPGPYVWERETLIATGGVVLSEDDPRWDACDTGTLTPSGAWSYRVKVIETDSGYYPPHGPDADFLAACSPERIIALLDALDAAEQSSR